jgi:hypothetical protein
MIVTMLIIVLTGWRAPGAPNDPAVLADLKPTTAAAFQKYIQGVETQVDERVTGKKNFLWLDDSPARRGRVQRGEVVTERTTGTKPTDVPDGLVHDWIGAAFIKGVTLAQTIAFVQDYDHHKEFYGPEVVDARILSRDGEHFKLYMRLKKQKMGVTVVLNTEHDAQFFPLDQARWHSRSRTTKVAEVTDAGAPRESEKPVGSGGGYMWNLDSYWRFVERDGGVYVECEAVSLSRDIPWRWLLGPIIGPIVNDLPKDSLMHTLTATQKGVTARASKPLK